MISSFSVERACAMQTWRTSAVTATVETAMPEVLCFVLQLAKSGSAMATLELHRKWTSVRS